MINGTAVGVCNKGIEKRKENEMLLLSTSYLRTKKISWSLESTSEIIDVCAKLTLFFLEYKIGLRYAEYFIFISVFRIIISIKHTFIHFSTMHLAPYFIAQQRNYSFNTLSPPSSAALSFSSHLHIPASPVRIPHLVTAHPPPINGSTTCAPRM